MSVSEKASVKPYSLKILSDTVGSADEGNSSYVPPSASQSEASPKDRGVHYMYQAGIKSTSKGSLLNGDAEHRSRTSLPKVRCVVQ